METFPFHYSRRVKPDESMDSNLRVMLDELQKMEVHLGDQIDGCYNVLEQHIIESELEKQMGGL
jgi:hypothetical protein